MGFFFSWGEIKGVWTTFLGKYDPKILQGRSSIPRVQPIFPTYAQPYMEFSQIQASGNFKGFPTCLLSLSENQDHFALKDCFPIAWNIHLWPLVILSVNLSATFDSISPLVNNLQSNGTFLLKSHIWPLWHRVHTEVQSFMNMLFDSSSKWNLSTSASLQKGTFTEKAILFTQIFFCDNVAQVDPKN